MPDENDAPASPTQETRPAKGKPVKIPIPTREAVIRDLLKTVKLPDAPPSKRET